MKIELKDLINSLDIYSKQYLESAAQRCIQRSGSEIIIEDILYVMLLEENSLFNKLLIHYKIDSQKLFNVIESSSKMTVTESNNPIFSNLLIKWLEESYLLSVVQLSQKKVRESS